MNTFQIPNSLLQYKTIIHPESITETLPEFIWRALDSIHKGEDFRRLPDLLGIPEVNTLELIELFLSKNWIQVAELERMSYGRYQESQQKTSSQTQDENHITESSSNEEEPNESCFEC